MDQIALLDVFAATQMDSSQAPGFQEMRKDPLDDGSPLPNQPLSVARLAAPAIGMESLALALIPMPLASLKALSLRDVGSDPLIPV